MKILDAEQIRKADAFTIKNEVIESIDLMERAANKCFDWICDNLDVNESTFHIFCGTGNNGGDGLVLARLFASKGNKVVVYVVRLSDKTSSDFKINFDRLVKSKVTVVEVTESEFTLNYGPQDLVIDGIFGTGLNKPVRGWLKNLIQHINEVPVMTLSIDIPSGLFSGHNDENDLNGVVKADITLTFQRPKLAFVLPESGSMCGQWEVLDIGLNEDFLDDQKSEYHILDENWIWLRLKEREKFDHKGNFGHALIACGSKGKIGASVLAARACLRSGIGLLTVFVPECGYDIVQTTVPEAMCMTSVASDELDDIPKDVDMFNVIGSGPGIGTGKHAKFMLKNLINSQKKPIVLDADALNILSEDEALLSQLPENSILTPHLGEFRRIVGAWKSDKEKLEKQVALSEKYNVIVVLKGSHTSISNSEGKVYFNTTGNPGMATAGSGDVLLGMITGLLGRGYEPIEAACLGVYLHGLSGDIASLEFGEESMKAGDIVDFIPEAIRSVY